MPNGWRNIVFNKNKIDLSVNETPVLPVEPDAGSSLGLYVHIPWCVKKCPYCDFNSHVNPQHEQDLPEQQYLTTLLEDLDCEVAELKIQRKIQSIFIGGGTPSLMSGNFYKQLMAEIQHRLPLAKNIEITLEANPGTVDEHSFDDFFAAGINRLSLGVQSFSDIALKKLGRVHNSTAALRAFKRARAAGFKNINIDLMHGLPQQSSELALNDLKQAIELAPEHLSWYQLTIEQNTAFYKQPPTLPNEDILTDIFLSGQQCLASAGYQQYEVSAFAKQNFQSQHNKNYWLFGDYIGIGAGAHGKITQNGVVTRRWKTRTPKDYLASQQKLAGENIIAQKDLVLEFMMNALRLNEGFSSGSFVQCTGLALSSIETVLESLQRDELLEVKSLYIKPTAKGRLFLNDVIERFIN